MSGIDTKLAFVVDSTTILDKSWADIAHVEIVPLYVTVGETTKPEPEWSVDEIVKEYETKPVHSSCPSPNDFLTHYQSLFKAGYQDLIVIPMDKSISGTYQSAVLAKEALEDDQKAHVFIVDIPLANFGVATAMDAAVPLIQEGKDAKSIAQAIADNGKNSLSTWTLGSLDYLYKGGRLQKLSFMIGKILRIKPVIGIDKGDGKLKVFKKSRTFDEIDKYFMDRLKELCSSFKTVYVKFINLGDEKQVEGFAKLALGAYSNIVPSYISEVGPVFTVHLGRNGYGFTAIGVDPLPKKEESNLIKSVLDMFGKKN